ncbi:alpha/beta hydrolase [Maribacter sp. 2-571]|uniref:alpha/beta hydrolase n=1 Tax=Maribacter sp. 2-571 TaxID=3417569 RepID=UPI003D343159
MKYFFSFLLVLLWCAPAQGQELLPFKKIDTTQLFLEVHKPENFDSSKDYPAMIFFFGGGWIGGNRSHFLQQARYFSKRGLVCFLADYRTKVTHGTTPFEALKDAKSAMRYVRKNAKDLHIDPTKIIAAGGSAGGHLAAATALISDFNEEGENLKVSCIPNALVLFNPVIDNGPGGYGYERILDAYKDFSPLHNIKKDAPPTLLMLGTADELIPVATAKYYATVMEKVGSPCTLKLYEDQPHGFFNTKHPIYFEKTLNDADSFLQELNYLPIKLLKTKSKDR